MVYQNRLCGFPLQVPTTPLTLPKTTCLIIYFFSSNQPSLGNL
jgi:hypothetical protein